jgi:hypothetical protein
MATLGAAARTLDEALTAARATVERAAAFCRARRAVRLAARTAVRWMTGMMSIWGRVKEMDDGEE